MDDSWDLHMERWLAGSMSSEEAQAFLQRTNADPQRLARLGRILRQQALLAEHLGALPAVAPSRNPRRRTWHRWGWSAAAAAAALIAMVMGWWTLPGEPAMARVAATAGEPPHIERAGRRIATTALISGDIVRTGSTSAQLTARSMPTRSSVCREQLLCREPEDFSALGHAEGGHSADTYGRSQKIMAIPVKIGHGAAMPMIDRDEDVIQCLAVGDNPFR